MIVRFDKISGIIINIVNNEHFVQSDTNTHDIEVIFDNNFDNTNYNAYIQFLRQGETKPSPKLVMTPKVITYNNEIYKGYSFKVQTDWYTAIAGTLKATIEVKEYNDDGLQSNKAYGIINIPIEEAVDDNPQVVSTITDEEYLALINLVNSKLNIDDEKVHLIEDTTMTNYDQFVDACIAHKTKYNKTRIYLGLVSSQPAIGLIDTNDDVTIISSTGVITRINRDGIETNITLNQVKVGSLKVESYFENGNIKIKDVPLLNISDSSWSNYPASIKTMLDYVTNQRSAIETEINANSTSDRKYASDLVATLKQQVQNGTVTAYGAQNAVRSVTADNATKAQYDNAGNQFITYYLKYIDIVDDLSSLETLKPLSAYQGKILKDKIDAIQAIISSDDVSLDTIQEIVDYIKDNKADIDGFLATKVNISDVIDNLTSTHTNKPLSANQGRILKELIDEIVNGTTTVATKGYVDSKIGDINSILDNINGEVI